MGRKIDFDDCTNDYSMKLRRTIKEACQYIYGEGMSMTMRKASRELMIPRRTLHRYVLEYTQLLDMSWPDYDDYGEQINYDEMMLWCKYLIRHNKRKYQTRGGG